MTSGADRVDPGPGGGRAGAGVPDTGSTGRACWR